MCAGLFLLLSDCFGVVQGAIFAQVEAFIERCRNLIEVCDGQIQFARRCVPGNGGVKAELPKFGGSKGPEISQVCMLLCMALLAWAEYTHLCCWTLTIASKRLAHAAIAARHDNRAVGLYFIKFKHTHLLG